MSSEMRTVYLHIGTPKSGTTYLQSRIAANHEATASQGLLWPGPGWGHHVRAARELRHMPEGGSLPADGPWARLVADVQGWHGRSALLSMEWLASLEPHQIAYAVESLRPHRVAVVCTARDLLRNFVAQSQQMAKNYREWPWEQIVQEVREDIPGPANRNFWSQQDVPAILARWSEHVPLERVHLVTVPPAGADPRILWERFCSVLQIDGSEFAEAPKANESLGATSARFLQRLNAVAREQGMERDDYNRIIRERVRIRILYGRREQEDPIAVDAAMDAFLRTRADEQVEQLRELGPRLVGEWDDLRPTRTLQGRRPDEVTDAELFRLSLEVILQMGVSLDQELERRREAGARAAKRASRRAEQPQQEAPSASPWRRRAGRLTRAVRRMR